MSAFVWKRESQIALRRVIKWARYRRPRPRGQSLILRLDETWPWGDALRRSFRRPRPRSHNMRDPAPDPTTSDEVWRL